MSYTVTIVPKDIELVIECKDCGSELTVHMKDTRDYTEIAVEPCNECMAAEYNRGQDAKAAELNA